MSKQARKYAVGLAGEFLVAGELFRRGIMAAVTYGNAKKADVVAIYEDKAASLEVKSTSEDKWVLGNSLPEASQKIWVLVYLPTDETQPPEFFILASIELRKLILPEHESYLERYRSRHGKDFSSDGVISLKRRMLGIEHRSARHKVKNAVGMSS